MPSFCRHNRLESTCPVCSRKRAREQGPSAGPSRSATRPGASRRSTGSSRRRATTAGGVRVRRLSRAEDDGYAGELVPGLHASADAARLADELAFAAARLDVLGSAAPGAYGEAARLARAGEPEEALWLLFLTAYVGPLDGDAPFAEIDRVRVPWATGELPDLDGVRIGPRGAYDPAHGTRTLSAYRAWAGRAGSQAAAFAGEAAWTPERRFDRVFERLALPGLPRAARYELLLTAGRVGAAALEPASLHLVSDPRDATVTAAKRVFGIGDPLLLQRRAGALAAAAAVEPGALDLALLNWARLTDDAQAERITGGVDATADPDVLALVRSELGLAEHESADVADDAGDD